MCGGELPWEDEEDTNNILQQRQEIDTKELCKGLPPVFEHILQHAEMMAYTQQPEYKIWKQKPLHCRSKLGLLGDSLRWEG
ncbi:hypothetical protein FRB94_005753 [Tulasnella sp. JGI-2019a]|nr:hypothetical protein FRB93_002837 [Tulasnella sp. JGI-2019a]KAG8983358.1 hypothetical protein FRB94_005753 [Tulasnella sp. JGI-2019a]KAG9018672.1 hypothetical protein FRB95_005944 [Tulasnella sp. JGI-2019a]